MTRATLAATYIACVVLANVLTEHLGLVPIGFGLVVTAGTFAAGGTLLARNLLQTATGLRTTRARVVVLALMAAGVALSWWLATPALAVASGVAFALSESADMAVFTPLQKRGWSRAALCAAAASSVVDTVVFLHLAGFPITGDSVTGQVAVKFGVSAVAVLLAGGARAVLRQPDRVAGRA